MTTTIENYCIACKSVARDDCEDRGHVVGTLGQSDIDKPLAPRAGERDTGEWYTDSKRSTDATIYARKGNQWIGQVHARFADQIVTEHNQHATLIEQRERLINAIRDIAIRSLLYCEQKYDHDDQARLNLEALLATIEQEGEASR